ncbi:pyridoxal 5'-phosphate synthase glutaminase subunit PdxT [bacterium]|nr:MAG: pyridoxal 5'-phosphate synthase glutaminase subunit PdxT [bacterium]
MRVGVIALQGDFEKHLETLRRASEDVEPVEVRTPEELAKVERAILPGGESTTVGLLMQRFGLGDALLEAAKDGMPLWGTCMGMIMLAAGVENRPEQYTLGLLDVDVRRNAFGAQVHSFEAAVPVKGLKEPVMGVFIRAPIVTRCGEGVEPIAEHDGHVVAVRQGNVLGTSFHPELTDDARMHEWFLKL